MSKKLKVVLSLAGCPNADTVAAELVARGYSLRQDEFLQTVQSLGFDELSEFWAYHGERGTDMGELETLTGFSRSALYRKRGLK